MDCLSRYIVRAPVLFLSKIFLKFNSLHLHNYTQFLKVVESTRKRPLITVSNHSATIDDLLIFANLPYRILFSNKLRTGLGAAEICFTNRFYAYFFTHASVLPIIRGSGIYQPAMDQAISLLNRNGWIHIFSEGKVNQTPHLLKFKWGIARLIMDCKHPPLVIPFAHSGIDRIMQVKSFMPKCGKRIDIVFGTPICTRDLLDSVKGYSLRDARIEITRFLEAKTRDLQKSIPQDG